MYLHELSSMNFFRIKQELGDKKKIEACAKEFGVIGDETRFKICYLLCHHPELSVSQIAKLLNLSISTVSHSLARLKEIKLVNTRKNAQTVYYSFNDSRLAGFLKSYIP